MTGGLIAPLFFKEIMESKIKYSIETIGGVNVLFSRNSSKIVNIQILTDIGSSDESPDQYGAAHFLEHMFFKGTHKRNAKEINQDADLMGAKLNAWTWHDQTNYHISVLEEHFEQGFELLSDIYLNAVFPENELEKERTVILSEMRRYDDDPNSYLSDRAVDAYCLNGKAHKVIGTEESVTQLTRDALVKFKEDYYNGENILISIVGDVDYERVKRLVATYFNSVKSCKRPEKLVPGAYGAGVFEEKKVDLQECPYMLLYPALPHLHEQSGIQSVMLSVLGGNASSLLFERIREELGLCYGIYSRAYRFEGFNYVEIQTGCAEKDIQTVHDEVLKVIAQLKNELIEDKRLQMVKASMLSSLYMGIESSSGLNSLLAMASIRKEQGDFIQRRIDQIKKTSAEDIRNLAQLTFAPDPMLAIMKPA